MDDKELEDLHSRISLYCTCPVCGRVVSKVSPGSAVLDTCKCGAEISFYTGESSGKIIIFYTPKHASA